MKCSPSSLLAAALAACLFCSCTTEPDHLGSLSLTEIHDALQSPQIAVTPLMPGWLLEPKDIHLLTHADRLKLVAIADKGIVRQIPESYYEQAEQGNRGDESSQLFYLYASDAQCLGCRVVKGKRILIDDLELGDAETKALYDLLIPYVKKMAAKVTPEQKLQAAAIAAQKAYEKVQAGQNGAVGNGMPALPEAPSPAAPASPAAPSDAPAATPATPSAPAASPAPSNAL